MAAPATAAPAVAAQQRRHLRFNFAAAVVDAGGWNLGMGLISHLTLLPMLVRELAPATWSPAEVKLAVGLIPATMLLGWLIPGILFSSRVDRLPRIRGPLMLVAMLERLMLLLVAAACMLLADQRLLVLGIFFLCWLVMNAAVGANTPGYYKLIAKVIPTEYRGRVYGFGGAVAGLVGYPAALLSGWMLNRWGFPGGYAACFMAAFIIQTASVAPLGFIREPEQAPEDAPPAAPPWTAVGDVFREPRLRLLLLALTVFGINQAATGFYSLHAVERLGAGQSQVADMTGVLIAAKAVTYLIVGWLGDRFGNRLALKVATAAGAASALLVLAAPNAGWMNAVFALNELAVQGWGVCGVNYVLEVCPPARSSSYTAAYGLLSGPSRVLLPVAAGWVAGTLGSPVLFGMAAFGALVALLAIQRLPEPRDTPVPRGPQATPTEHPER